MGTTNFLFSSVTRWCNKFKSGVDSVEDAPHARRPKTATSQKILEKVTNLVATDARFTTRHIAKCVGISVGAAHLILRRDLKKEKDKCQMNTPSRYKRTKTCRSKNRKTIVETVP